MTWHLFLSLIVWAINIVLDNNLLYSADSVKHLEHFRFLMLSWEASWIWDKTSWWSSLTQWFLINQTFFSKFVNVLRWYVRAIWLGFANPLYTLFNVEKIIDFTWRLFNGKESDASLNFLIEIIKIKQSEVTFVTSHKFSTLKLCLFLKLKISLNKEQHMKQFLFHEPISV